MEMLSRLALRASRSEKRSADWSSDTTIALIRRLVEG
jgi:hypothetical protein